MNPIYVTEPAAAQSDTLADTVTPATPAPADDAALRKRATAAAEKFEGFFIAQMLKQMRASSAQFAPEGSVFKDPVTRDMLDLADGMLADQMAGQHAFGVADAILRQLLPPPRG